MLCVFARVLSLSLAIAWRMQMICAAAPLSLSLWLLGIVRNYSDDNIQCAYTVIVQTHTHYTLLGIYLI